MERFFTVNQNLFLVKVSESPIQKESKNVRKLETCANWA